MSNLNPDQFLHYTNHEFKPGDEVLPPSERGVKSQYAKNQHYRGDKVYLHTAEAQYDLGSHHFGVHAYVVEPVGKVEPDPEAQHLLKTYDPEPESLEHDRWNSWKVAPKARVIRHFESNDAFDGQGSGIPR